MDNHGEKRPKYDRFNDPCILRLAQGLVRYFNPFHSRYFFCILLTFGMSPLYVDVRLRRF
jgi:hypothetical protein